MAPTGRGGRAPAVSPVQRPPPYWVARAVAAPQFSATAARSRRWCRLWSGCTESASCSRPS